MKTDNSEKRVIIYCRESRDEYGYNYERIETQRDLLVKFCKKNGYKNIIKIIMDDDRSGTDFSRFDNIKQMAGNKEFDAIVFKNSARLGRNQMEALRFVQYMEQCNVEIVFEDEKYDEELFGLYAWFNERRASDDSKNIRRNLRHKMEEGLLCIKAIYGYDKENQSWVINPKTAPVVKRIFYLRKNGYTYGQIVEYLNEKSIPTPSVSRNYSGCKKTSKWNKQHIKRILCDRRYTGDYVGGTTEKVSFKSKKIRATNVEDWVVIKNHHKKIISEKIFKEVQCLNKENS